MKLYAGIDPGGSGGIAFMNEEKSYVIAYKMPATPYEFVALIKKEISLHQNAMVVDLSKIEIVRFAFVEKVHSMPKQGVASTFKFGTNFGMIQGVLAALDISHDLVPPGVWQRKMKAASGGDKNVTKAIAQRRFPNAKTPTTRGITHAIADALLIAEYCVEVKA